MPILRAGPWGNLSDSFQNTGSTGAYPVNIAKGNWPTQNWAAWYEAEVAAGCCTPATVSVTNAYLSSMTRDEDCYYLEQYLLPYDYTYSTQSLSYNPLNGTWTLYWIDANRDALEAYLINNDPCDPTGTYTEIHGEPDPVVSTP